MKRSISLLLLSLLLFFSACGVSSETSRTVDTSLNDQPAAVQPDEEITALADLPSDTLALPEPESLPDSGPAPAQTAPEGPEPNPAPESLPEPVPEPKPDPKPEPVPEPEPVQTPKYVGSVKSDKYHYPSCSSAGQIKSSNEIWFTSAADAISSGYVACKRCKPPAS